MKAVKACLLHVILFLGYLICHPEKSFSQANQKLQEVVKSLPFINNPATIKGFPINKTLHVSKTLLSKGFRLVLWDSLYNIEKFLLSYYAEFEDVWVAEISGDSVTLKKVKILDHLKSGEWMEFSGFIIGKGGKHYTAPSFSVIITE